MERTDELKKKVENAESRDQIKEEFKKAEVILNDEDLANVSGGIDQRRPPKGENYNG